MSFIGLSQQQRKFALLHQASTPAFILRVPAFDRDSKDDGPTGSPENILC